MGGEEWSGAGDKADLLSQNEIKKQHP